MSENEFFHELKCDRITSLHGIHVLYFNNVMALIYSVGFDTSISRCMVCKESGYKCSHKEQFVISVRYVSSDGRAKIKTIYYFMYKSSAERFCQL